MRYVTGSIECQSIYRPLSKAAPLDEKRQRLYLTVFDTLCGTRKGGCMRGCAHWHNSGFHRGSPKFAKSLVESDVNDTVDLPLLTTTIVSVTYAHSKSTFTDCPSSATDVFHAIYRPGQPAQAFSVSSTPFATKKGFKKQAIFSLSEIYLQ